MSAPLVPADLDLRDFPFMPVDVRRLLTSETWLTATGDEKSAAMTLWLESWHQVPAGSLPDNDRMLSILSQAGGRWKKVRPAALRGWVKADDGRLYHPVVCEKALEAWDRKHAQRQRTEAARQARLNRAVTSETTDTVTSSVTDDVTASKGQGQGQREEEPHPPSPGSGGVPDQQSGFELEPEKPRAADRAAYPPEFEDLWQAYRPIASPNATKADAHKAWARLKPPDRLRCADGLKRYVSWLDAERKRRPDTPAKHLSTFINKRGWEPFLDLSTAAPSEVAPKDEREARLRLLVGRDRQMWPTPKWGPMPNRPGCLIPAHLVEPGDGTGWAEWGEGH